MCQDFKAGILHGGNDFKDVASFDHAFGQFHPPLLIAPIGKANGERLPGFERFMGAADRWVELVNAPIRTKTQQHKVEILIRVVGDFKDNARGQNINRRSSGGFTRALYPESDDPR